jgi:hypothetical protein
MSNKSQDKNYDFDETTKAAVSKLWKERTQGRFKNDRQGFTQAFLDLHSRAKFDESRELPSNSLLSSSSDDSSSMEQVYQEMIEERKLMTAELTEQLSLRVRQHMFLKQRKQSDFARAGRSETSIFERQVSSHDNAVSKLEQQAQ